MQTMDARWYQLYQPMPVPEQLALFAFRGTAEWDSHKWRIIQANIPFVVHVAVLFLKKRVANTLKQQSLVEEMTAEVIPSMPYFLDKYDPDSPAKLHTYLGLCIHRVLQRHWFASHYPVKVPKNYDPEQHGEITRKSLRSFAESDNDEDISLAECLPDLSANDPCSVAEQEEIRELMRQIISEDCTEKEQRCYHGFSEGLTTKQIAIKEKVSAAIISRRRQSAFVKLVDRLAMLTDAEEGEYNPYPLVRV